ncbi:MAG TPA: hypothetical protein VJM14_08795 [Burkholderiales bacterium]|nr:hypothetical protein [Burkholderiales bacterium]
MDLTRFKGCAEAYGADRRRWPAREHALYDRFAGTPEGAAILAEAERTDRFLDALEVAAPDAALGRAITNLPSQRSGAGGRRRFWIPAAAFAASAILGFAIGFAQVRDDGNADLVTQLLLGPESVREIGL